MVTNEVKPINSATPRPGRGRMTWIGLGALILFAVTLAFVVLRPIIARHDGPERGVAQVVQPAVTQTGP